MWDMVCEILNANVAPSKFFLNEVCMPERPDLRVFV